MAIGVVAAMPAAAQAPVAADFELPEPPEPRPLTPEAGIYCCLVFVFVLLLLAVLLALLLASL